jgi:hypothetical protein
MNHKLSISTQYGQFYVADKDSPGNTGGKFWNDEASDDRLAIDVGILGISVENDEATANIEIELMATRPVECNFNQFDHVVEGSLSIESGKLQIKDCPNSHVELEITLDPAWYRLQVCSLNLSKAYQINPEDKYLIRIWKESFSRRRVLKKWHRS